MRLRQLKLAGFKSFVDPIVVPFPSQLVAVVGPNGCGKSNIIDAVRWVMGESHAKNLRGESMADVIFKGSSNRKPVGQASVELVFDNHLGRLTGPYASYQDIAVKRLVTRDGESSYYLNGTRCRRRDITDIFLGTGAGARGYSIIGQDTISRLIEARPEELRAYLEEAAGVSKYKDRRRDALQRITHTRDNLARVADIQAELEKQLARLERQAKAAQRYTELKQQERQRRTEVLILKWHILTTEAQHCHSQLQQLTLQQETHYGQIAALGKTDAIIRDELAELLTRNEQTQVQFYQLAADIARLEETIQQQARDKAQLKLDQQQLEMDREQASTQLQGDSDALHIADQSSQQLHSTVQQLQQQVVDAERQVSEHQQRESRWNADWQAMLTTLQGVERQAELDAVRLQHLDDRHQHLMLAIEKNQDEYVGLDAEQSLQDLQRVQEQHVNVLKEHSVAVANHQQILKQGMALRQQFIEIEQQLHHTQDQTQALAMEHATLAAAQKADFQRMINTLPTWDNQSRVAELIDVDDAWLRMAECVLGDSLHAIVLDSIEEVWPELAQLQGQSAVFTQSQQTKETNKVPYPRLLDKLSGMSPCWSVAVETIFAADHVKQALTWLPTLAPHQSVITPDGYWLGQGWVRVFNVSPTDEIGLLSRQHALTELNGTLTQAQARLVDLIAQRDQLHQQCVLNEQEQRTAHEYVSTVSESLRTVEMQNNQKQQHYEHLTSKREHLQEERINLDLELETIAEQRFNLDTNRKHAIAQQQVGLADKHRLTEEKSQWETQLSDAKQALDTAKIQLQTTQLQWTQATATVHHLRDQTARTKQHIDTLAARWDALQQRTTELMDPAVDLQAILTQHVHDHHHLETTLLAGKQQAEEVQQRLQQTEQLSKQEEQHIKQLQDKLQQVQLQEQTATTRLSDLVEQLNELDEAWETLELSTDLTIHTCEQDLATIDEQLKRLGAINLLAIEEYQTDLQRKEHLDAQSQDLQEALSTLERAIAKMDNETESRLRETFDQVNTSFQALFPRLFGGGHATLELTCDNLLEAGILVMAQPPGKRNNTIYMLSGGEKAMTAVALVFAIFQLNPSPFCMLDEVDAPLDEANVRRFCDLVKDMSHVVQFLFITHNKVTMELADHLIGVTMREPGVSRIVSVESVSN